MDITRVRVIRYRIPFVTPYVTAAGSASHRAGFIVHLETGIGACGIGEASYLPHVSGLDALSESLQRLGAKAAGTDMAEFTGSRSTKMELGWPGFQMALCDVIARARGESLSAMLGGPATPFDVPVNALIGGATLDSIRAAAVRARDEGYGTVKLKAGVAESIGTEMERVAAVREALGPDLKLRIDPNGAWTVDQAIESIQALSAYDIEYVEQPIAPGDVAGMCRLQDVLETPIAADEDVTDPQAALLLLAARAARVLIVKPLSVGGINASRDILSAAFRSGALATITTSIDTGVGTAAALHIAATLPERAPACGLATLSLLEDDLIEEGLPIVRGTMRTPEGHGLGVTLDEAAVARYAVGVWEYRA